MRFCLKSKNKEIRKEASFGAIFCHRLRWRHAGVEEQVSVRVPGRESEGCFIQENTQCVFKSEGKKTSKWANLSGSFPRRKYKFYHITTILWPFYDKLSAQQKKKKLRIKWSLGTKTSSTHINSQFYGLSLNKTFSDQGIYSKRIWWPELGLSEMVW